MGKQRVRFENGRYEVELPWRRDSIELSDNFSLAKRRLGSLMRKMQSDEVLYSEYCKVFKNYLDEGIIEKVLEEEMRLEKSDEEMELPKETEKVRPLESERAYMLSMDPEAVAQPVTVEEDNCLPRDSSNENS
ncbi:uncharacterized protein LOC102076250 [Trichonephila inaurata madagascariensis]|uniref:Uncharacterized protein LOC102076250 n=1 Tax=Trichonephila inaurata madagascariensis TaxID=2747483 RepID=A0A8X6X9Z4_9ARAC|nr:uncharacterized protein LOC102076250 [Trichonephila inaurata madagascariensis]